MSAEQKSRKASDRKYAVACFLSIYEVNTEAGIPEVRDKIESAYGGAKMYDHGGAMGVSCDCDEYQGMHHLADDHFFIELVDPDTLEPIPFTNFFEKNY